MHSARQPTDYNIRMSEGLLEARDLRVLRGDRTVIKRISFQIASGDYLELRGANGAGKTSLLRAVAGLLPLDAGEICWLGKRVNLDRESFRRDSIYLGHDAPLKGDFTALENLFYWLGLRRPQQRNRIVAALQEVGLRAEAMQRPCRQLSAGQRRRVSLAALLLAEARLWLLDEPTTQLDSDGQGLVARLIGAHLERGGSAFVSMHTPLIPAPESRQVLQLAPA